MLILYRISFRMSNFRSIDQVKSQPEMEYLQLVPGFRSREPAIKIDGSETLRHPVDILLLELMKAYIF